MCTIVVLRLYRVSTKSIDAKKHDNQTRWLLPNIPLCIECCWDTDTGNIYLADDAIKTVLGVYSNTRDMLAWQPAPLKCVLLQKVPLVVWLISSSLC